MGNVYSGSDPKNKLRVREVDGTPNVSPVNTIVVSNGTLTNDGGGQVTITTGGGGGGGGIGGSIAVNQVAVGSGADTISGSSGLTFTDSAGVQTFLVSGSEARIQAQDTTAVVGNRATITIDPSVPDGTGGVGMFWGTDSDLELYMKLGAFSGANNIETKNRDFRFFGATGNLITMDESALNTAVGGIFGLSNGSDPLPLPTRTLDVGKTDSSTSTVLPLLGLTRTSSGTPAAGIGVGMEFVVETTSNNNEIGATINAVATEVGSGGENFDLVFNTMTAGATANEKLRISSTGSITLNDSYAFPAADGNPNDFLITDGAGALLFSPFPNAQPTPAADIGAVIAALSAAGIFV